MASSDLGCETRPLATTPSSLQLSTAPHSPALSRRSALALAALASGVASGLLSGCKLPFMRKQLGGTELSSSLTRLTPSLQEAPELTSAVAACDQLGAQLLASQLADGAHANALASPASLALNLATAAVGATDPATQGLNTLLGCTDEAARNTTWAAATAALNQAKAAQATPTVNLSLPRLDLQTGAKGVDLLPVLEALGADIKPMGRINPQYQTLEYRQQVRLIVQEDGTKAAAVTEHRSGKTAVNIGDVVDFVVDHPYVLRLRDLATGLCLFEAVINSPN
ncbi:Serine protease inhibitor [Actinomyces bovis]|uniref:Serine protease inhibitor n=1 Tax=Actinomyces bovis TaxID=1658 RepID=A0ABY1VPA9_9ACTO|nr:serpin family protein [Actinomyces bovis]SPT53633.1 Serine protease inhibitor [Actinomyces bovis]VEG55696.1 Serine protease inhibitor [Actinomyces israelii]